MNILNKMGIGISIIALAIIAYGGVMAYQQGRITAWEGAAYIIVPGVFLLFLAGVFFVLAFLMPQVAKLIRSWFDK